MGLKAGSATAKAGFPKAEAADGGGDGVAMAGSCRPPVVAVAEATGGASAAEGWSTVVHRGRRREEETGKEAA